MGNTTDDTQEILKEIITIPKQKTLIGNSANELDELANQWLKDRALKKQPPPMLGKAGSVGGGLYVVYYWFDKEEIIKDQNHGEEEKKEA